ncbi:succinyl-diaminopimelate desuccinylase [Pseudomonadales bacterium]|nr:succinyl-diaminopimelate desuccinylase [Pseudomonadales bacterium]MDB9866368.1 succinyl-diaminopimelate desuccinylase [Pseudomonadales bacterium]
MSTEYDPARLDAETLALAQQLICAESVSPDDAGCQVLMAEYLSALGFRIESMPFGDVDNLWALHGDGTPLFVFAGHTDVVPPGPLDDWHTPPFAPTIKDGLLFGRGAADMKGSLAAMLTACRRFLAAHADHPGTIGFLITSDEEAAALNGTRRVIEELQSRGTHIDWCLVGEPSSNLVLGDVVRCGRRGSLNAQLSIKGVQGHVAYPTEALNPIHSALPALAKLVDIEWDAGNDAFPPTSLQISNIHSGTGANNVIPGEMQLLLNFRFSTASSEASLRQRTETLLQDHGVDYEINWSLSGLPFLTSGGELIPAVQKVLAARLGIVTELSTSGGTSDGRFIAPTGTQVVELGPRNNTIHKINECVATADLIELSHIYSDILEQLLVEETR